MYAKRCQAVRRHINLTVGRKSRTSCWEGGNDVSIRVRRKRMNVESKSDQGCERFLDIDVSETTNAATFDAETLDRAGRKRARQAKPYSAVLGRLTVKWRDAKAREECEDYQTKRNRWNGVIKNAARLKNGETPPCPVFLAPDITGTDLYRNIDGARRIMAVAESQSAGIECIILRRRCGACVPRSR